MLQEVESMIKSKHSSRAVALLHYIQLLPLVLPVPTLQDMCLSNIDIVTVPAATANNIRKYDINDISTSNELDVNDKTKKKKKKNNEIEVYPENTPEECSFITQSINDFHPYGASGVLLQFFFEKSSQEIDSIIPMVEQEGVTNISTKIEDMVQEKEINENVVKSNHIIKMSKFMKLKTPYLRHFLKDLKNSQNDEAGKVLK